MKWYGKLLWIFVDKIVLIICAFIVLALLSIIDFSYYTVMEKLTGEEVLWMD